MPSENGTIQIVIKHIPNVMFAVIIKQFCHRRVIVIQQQLPQNILNWRYILNVLFFFYLSFLASWQARTQILCHYSKSNSLCPQNFTEAVSFLTAKVCGEGEDGAAGTLRVNTHTEEKTAVPIKPLGRQQLSASADELLNHQSITHFLCHQTTHTRTQIASSDLVSCSWWST